MIKNGIHIYWGLQESVRQTTSKERLQFPHLTDANMAWKEKRGKLSAGIHFLIGIRCYETHFANIQVLMLYNAKTSLPTFLSKYNEVAQVRVFRSSLYVELCFKIVY